MLDSHQISFSSNFARTSGLSIFCLLIPFFIMRGVFVCVKCCLPRQPNSLEESNHCAAPNLVSQAPLYTRHSLFFFSFSLSGFSSIPSFRAATQLAHTLSSSLTDAPCAQDVVSRSGTHASHAYEYKFPDQWHPFISFVIVHCVFMILNDIDAGTVLRNAQLAVGPVISCGPATAIQTNDLCGCPSFYNCVTTPFSPFFQE